MYIYLTLKFLGLHRKLFKWSSSVDDTIKGKTADLIVVQKTIIDTLHKEDNTQKLLVKMLAVHILLCPSMLIDGRGKRKDVLEKTVQATVITTPGSGL